MSRSTIYNNGLTDEFEKVNKKNKVLIEDFIKYCKAMDKAQTTIKNYENQLKIFFCWNKKENKDKFFVEIKRKEIVDFLGYARMDLQASPSRIASFKSVLSSLSSAIEILYEDKYKNFRNLVKGLEPVRKASVRTKTILSSEQINEMLEELIKRDEKQLACYLSLLASSGCRVSEALQMKIDFFNPKHEVFGGYMYLTDNIRTKGKGSIGKVMGRYVIKSCFKPYLDLWIEERKQKDINIKELFVVRRNDRWEKAKISTAYSFVERINKIFNVDFYNHSARHYMVSQLRALNLSSEQIKEVLKWSDVSLVDIYDDSSTEERLGKIFNNLD